MCGIAGYVYLQGSGPSKVGRLKKMAQSLAHRGPDGEGYYHTNQVALAHRRLSIIDLETGAIIRGEKTIDQMAEEVLEFIIEVASGTIKTKARLLDQNDFIPWRRGVSL